MHRVKITRNMILLTRILLLCLLFLHDLPTFTLADFSASYSRIDTSTCGCQHLDNSWQPQPHISTSWTSKLLKLAIAFGIKNTVATGIIFLITLLNVFVHKLRQLHEESIGHDICFPPLHKHCRHFTFSEVQSATHNFDEALVIGKGGFGKVYRAVLHDGTNHTNVAMKRLNAKSRQGAREFWTEIDMLSKFRHSHLVSLIGYCDDLNEMILVYEYMPHGTLADQLYKIKRNISTGTIYRPLSWEQRLKICIDAARGLEYLHTGTGVKHRVIHRDVKSSNILLDKNFVAKISDFGLSKIGPANKSSSHISTGIKGTRGYLDPQYFLSRRLTRKSDVYSFGVVLFEVLCGRAALDYGFDPDQQALAVCVQNCIREGTLDKIIDTSLRNQISEDSQKAFVEIGNRCLHSISKKRPTMAEVVAKLELSLELQKMTESFPYQAFHVGDLVNVDVALDQNRSINETNATSFDEKSGGHTPSEEKGKRKMLHSTTSLGVMRSHNIPKKDSTSTKRTGPSLGWLRKSFWYKMIPTTQHTESLSSQNMESLASFISYLNKAQIRVFSAAEIQVATKSLKVHVKVAPRAHYDVFKGYMDGHKEAAIKRFAKPCNFHTNFRREILPNTKHENLLSLCGYYVHKDEFYLVYEYMSNSSLHNHIHTKNGNTLPWKRRIKICIGVARGLNYLHTGMAGTKLVHGDLNLTSILLDENWVPKITRLWRCMCNCSDLSYTSITFVDARAYADPEYITSGHSSEKSDVYSVGMILLTVLPWLGNVMISHILPSVVLNDIKHETLHQVIHPRHIGEIAPECLVEFLDIALNCVSYPQSERPSMAEVVKRLEFALELQEKAEAATRRFDGFRILELDRSIYSQLLYRVQKLQLCREPASVGTLDSSIADSVIDSSIADSVFDSDFMDLAR